MRFSLTHLFFEAPKKEQLESFSLATPYLDFYHCSTKHIVVETKGIIRKSLFILRLLKQRRNDTLELIIYWA